MTECKSTNLNWDRLWQNLIFLTDFMLQSIGSVSFFNSFGIFAIYFADGVPSLYQDSENQRCNSIVPGFHICILPDGLCNRI